MEFERTSKAGLIATLVGLLVLTGGALSLAYGDLLSASYTFVIGGLITLEGVRGMRKVHSVVVLGDEVEVRWRYGPLRYWWLDEVGVRVRKHRVVLQGPGGRVRFDLRQFADGDALLKALQVPGAVKDQTFASTASSGRASVNEILLARPSAL